MKKIIVYTTGCPLCIALENILKQKNVEYEKVTDTEGSPRKLRIQTTSQ